MKIKKNILPLLLASALAAAGCTSANPDIGSAGSNADSQQKIPNSNGSTGNDTNRTDRNDNDASNDNSTDNAGSQNENAAGNTGSTTANPGSRVSASDLFSDRDLQNGYEEKGSAAIKLNGTSASCSSNAVKISGSQITITDEGTYILSGTLQDGMVIVDADASDKVQLVLNGADISCSASAAVYVRQADKVFLTTAANTENTLSNGGTYEAVDENNIDAAVFSKEDLTLSGKGSLKILAKAGHGVVSKDSLVMTGGNYDITAEKHGLSGKDNVCIADGTCQITAGKDGIHAENADDTSLGFLYIADGTFEITSEGDGISSAYFGQIEGGSFNIQAGGGFRTTVIPSDPDAASGQPVQSIQADLNIQSAENMASVQEPQNLPPSESMPDLPAPPDVEPKHAQTGTSAADTETVSAKGIKAGGNLWLDNGKFVIDAADDALHTNSSIAISGGSYQLASGDDGIHADDDAAISSGTIDITQSYEGIEGNTINISGGEISLVSDDDGLNAAGGTDSSGFGAHRDSFASSEGVYISISGGTLYVTASGDGIDSNGDLTISGGQTYVSGPSGSGNGSLDYNGEATITGGIFAAAGAMGMVQNFGSSSTQGAMLVQTDAGTKGDDISLADAGGKALVSWQAKTDYGCVIISCPELVQGNTYALTAGNTTSQIEMTSLIYGQDSGGRGGMNGGHGSIDGGRDGMDDGSGGMGGHKKGSGTGRMH